MFPVLFIEILTGHAIMSVYHTNSEGTMTIEELYQGQLAIIVVSFGQEHMEFNTMIEDINPKKKLIYTDPILRDDKPVSFGSSAVQTHLIVFFEDRAPQIFRNVQIHLTRRDKESLWYTIIAPTTSVEYNRRKHYRCYIGEDTSVMIGKHHTTYDAVLKDLSYGGFSFSIETERSCEIGDMVHFVLQDYIPELKERFSFSIYGIVVTKRDIENDRSVYGCRITSNTYGIDTYIAKKERVRLQKSRGGLSAVQPFNK